MTANDLCAQIVLNRDSACGRTTCAVESRHFDFEKETSSIGAILDEFVKKFGFLGAPVEEISAEQAEKIIRRILHKDLAYNEKISTPNYAETQAQRFIELFSGDAKFFSNGMFGGEDEKMRAWSPLSASTFDTGVVCFNSSRIGILWVEDED